MAVMFEHTQDVLPAVMAVSTYGAAWESEHKANPSSAILFQAPLNPGHGGTSLMMEYDLTYYLYGSSGSTFTALWQYKDATGSSWETLCSLTSALTANPHTVKISGISTAQMTMPIQIRAALTATAVTNAYMQRTSGLSYAHRFIFRSVGLIE